MEYTYNGGMEMAGSPEVKPAENFVMGLIGALGGALLGGASIILIGQIGYISAISGIILAFCTLKGYALLGKGALAWGYYGLSWVVTLLVAVFGIMIFNKVERNFMDTV